MFLSSKQVFTHTIQVAETTDSDTIEALAQLIERSKGAVKAELSFVVEVMAPIYQLIKVLQKDSGGVLDVLGEISRFCTLRKMMALLSLLQAEEALRNSCKRRFAFHHQGACSTPECQCR